MSLQMDGLKIYTVGHSNLEASDLVGMLLQHGVKALVDVRSSPYSQYATQFNRETFARTLAHVGIEYIFAGDYLGGRPKDPTCYKNGEIPPPKSDYLKLVDYQEVARRPWFKKGIARLMEIAGERPTAIMCSEEDPSQCHRHHLIAQTLLEHGVEVCHIRKQGTLEDAHQPQQLSLF
ncbi:MAG TPA: DUF488 domain-containing protein [Chloroflexia bacterium]|jgi:uncharacterized protein (DUF488 family)